MKKTFKFRRWMAFLLALILIATTCISSSDAFLRATGDEAEEEASEESSDSDDGGSEDDSDDGGGDYAEAVEIIVEEEQQEPTEEYDYSEEYPNEEPSPEEVSSEEPNPEEVIPPEGQNPEDAIPPQGTEPGADPAPEQGGEGQNYAYDIYFYYGDIEGRHIEGEGALGALILESAQVTVTKETVEYEGQKYDYAATENEDGRITENREANVVKVTYTGPVGGEETPEVQAPEEVPQPVAETYSLKFDNDSEKGSVKIVSASTEAVAENTYEKGTEVTFAVSAKEGSEVSAVKVQGGDELKGKQEQDGSYTYKVTMTGNMVVEVAYGDAVIDQIQSQMFKAGRVESPVYTVTVTFNFKDDENPMNKKSETWTTTEKSIDGLYLQTEKYPVLNGHRCVSYAFEDNVYRQGTCLYFGKDAKGNPIDKTEYQIDLWYDRCESLIVFETNGGESVASIAGETGEKIENRSMPTPKRGDDKFEGWYENKDFSGSPVKELPETYPEGMKVYYAKWQEKSVEAKYTVYYFDMDNKQIADPINREEKIGEKLFASDYEKEISGYSFEKADPEWLTIEKDSDKNVFNLYYTKIKEESKVKIFKKADRDRCSVGDTIHYTIMIENTGNCELSDVVIKDSMSTSKSTIPPQEFTFDHIGTPQSGEYIQSVSYDYSVQQNDAGQIIKNVVSLESKGIELEEESTLEAEVQVEDGEAVLALSKEITNLPEQGSFELGDTINYRVTAKNAGNMTLTGIEIVDHLKGVSVESWKPEEDKLAPGEEVSFETTYTVTEDDIVNGTVLNTVTGTAKDENGHEAKVTPATKDTAVEMKMPSLFVEKRVTDEAGKQYGLGDKVNYLITVKNNGTVPVNNISVADKEVELKESILNLPVGASAEYHVSYEIKEGDIQAGKFTNTVDVVGYYEKYHNTQEIKATASATVNTVSAQSHLTVSKRVISTPKDGDAYTLGEKIVYEIEVKNDGNQTLTNVSPKDELTGKVWDSSEDPGLKEMKPGDTWTGTTTYEVQEKDIIKGSVTNVAQAAGCSPDPQENVVGTGTVTVDTAKANADFTVEKKAVGNDSEKFYALNEVVDYTITVTNTGNVTLTNVDVKDALTGGEANFKDMAPGATNSFTTQYKVTEDDIRRGEVINKVNAGAKFANGYAKNVSAEETIKTVAKKPHLTISKKIESTPKNGATYALGETINYVIAAVNDGNQTLTHVVLKDPLTDEEWEISEIKPLESTDLIRTSHVVTADDIAKGEVVNVVTATGIGLDPERDVTPGEIKAYTVVSEPRLLVEKHVVGNDPDKQYKLGEAVNYIITVKNTGNVDINEIGVDDVLTEENWSIGTLKPNEKKEIKTKSHRVTEQEISEGQVVNKANAWGKPATGGNLNEEASATVKTEKPNSHLTVTKVTTSIPADGIAYRLGETIEYKIGVLNDGNITLHNVVVADPLTNQSWEIKEIKPNQSSTVMETSYVVQEADIIRGKVVNETVVKGVNDNDPEPTVIEGRTEDDTEGQSRLLILSKKVTSTPANGTAYALGETITYEIRALNKGNQTLYNVQVDDKLTGWSWTIPEIKPGQQSAAMETAYVVQEADIMNGCVYNVASAFEPKPPTDQPDLIIEPGEVTAPVVAENPSLFAKKEAKDINKSYAVGDEVEYTISVVNNGNETIYNIDIVDDLTGETWHIDQLATDGKSETFTTKYTVKEEDIRNESGKIVNVVTVKGLDPKGNPVETEATETVNTVPLQESMSVIKTVVNSKTQYDVDDVIEYQIAVKNTGNVTLHNVRVVDQLKSGSNGKVTFTDLAGGTQQSNGDILFSELKAGEEKFIKCEYIVVRGDANTSISNKAEVTSDEITTPVPGETGDTPIEKLYTLIVHYVYAAGGTAAEDYVGQYLAGESFGPIYSPAVNGYRPNMRFVRSGENGIPVMPGDKDTYEITVIYRASSPEPTDPTDPTPTPGPTDPTPTPGPTDPTPTPGPTDPTPTPGPTDPTPTPGPTDPTATPDPTPVPVPGNPIPVAVVPVAPTPVAGGGLPVALAVPEDLTEIGDGEVAGAMLDLDENGDPVLRAVTDDRVPLTNRDLDDHKCCILSFLLMLATWLIYTWYTHSMKKHQEKLAELKDQLEEGTLKKRLGLPDDWQATM